MDDLICRPIGLIRSPFMEPRGTPIQPTAAAGTTGSVEVFPEYAEGLEDLLDFSHIMLIYHFHMSNGYQLKVKPYLDDTARGLFSTRAPARPNPIGVSVVALDGIEGTNLLVRNLDIVDGTPLLDIKPYVPEFDAPAVQKTGWLEKKMDRLAFAKDDGRFSQKKDIDMHRRLRRRLYYGSAWPWCGPQHFHAPPHWLMEKPTREEEIEDLKEHIAHLKEDLKAAEEGLKELERVK